MALRSALINVMASAAKKAARGLLRDFGEVEQLQVSTKGPANFVSAADTRAEQVLVGELRRARPDFGVVSEQGGASARGDESQRWLVDPLDGTTNFLHGIPHFCLSIGLERDGEVVAGTVYDPLRNELFWAERGAGAYLNERRLRVSARHRLEDTVVATGIPHLGQPGHADSLARLGAIMPRVAGVRRLGSAALDLAFVAAGRYDGFWDTDLEVWDIAAGIVIVREAGGFVTDLDGGDQMLSRGHVLAANDKLHGPLGDVVRGAATPRNGSSSRPKRLS